MRLELSKVSRIHSSCLYLSCGWISIQKGFSSFSIYKGRHDVTQEVQRKYYAVKANCNPIFDNLSRKFSHFKTSKFEILRENSLWYIAAFLSNSTLSTNTELSSISFTELMSTTAVLDQIDLGWVGLGLGLGEVRLGHPLTLMSVVDESSVICGRQSSDQVEKPKS